MKLFLFLKGIMNSILSRIVDWWRGRPTVWKFILGIGAAVSVINEVINLYKNIWNEPIREASVVFSEHKENKVFPPCLDSFSYKTNNTKTTVFNGEDVGFMLRKMAAAYNVDRDYDGAKKYADILTRFFESLKLCSLDAILLSGALNVVQGRRGSAAKNLPSVGGPRLSFGKRTHPSKVVSILQRYWRSAVGRDWSLSRSGNLRVYRRRIGSASLNRTLERGALQKIVWTIAPRQEPVGGGVYRKKQIVCKGDGLFGR